MLSKKETMQLSGDFAEQDFLCSEAVLMALAKHQNVKSDLIPRIATGFGAGIGRAGEVCGALAGAIMGLGIRFGRSKVEEEESDERPHAFAQTMVNLFITRYGHTRCCDLIGLNLAKEQDRQKYYAQELWKTKCRDFVQTTAGLAYDLLEANKG